MSRLTQERLKPVLQEGHRLKSVLRWRRMSWEKSSADLIHLFQQMVPAGPNIVHKKMFGYLCAFGNGNLFPGLFRQSMIFRLSPADRAAFLDQPGTAEFEP